MSAVSTVTQIETQTLTYAPAAIAGIQAAEAGGQIVGAAGPSKLSAVLSGIAAGAQVGEAIPVPQVAAISGMINLFVSIFNALGIFKHAPAAAAPAALAQAAQEAKTQKATLVG